MIDDGCMHVGRHEPQSRVNIVKMSDGTTRKIMVQ